MTISTTTNRISYSGNGTTVDFSFPYAFFSTNDLVVVSTVTATGVQTTQTLTTDYTISGSVDTLGHYNTGGTVTAVTAPASTVMWTIYRDPSAVQSTDFVENDSLPAESLEAAIDYQTMLIQRANDRIARTLQQPEGDAATISRLPGLITRANKYLTFDSSGNPTATDAATASGTSVTATGSTTARLLATRFDDIANVLDYGAVADGVTDDSAAFTAAFAATGNGVWAPPSSASFYMVKDVTIPSGKTLYAHGAYFKDLAGASYLFTLTGYATKLLGAYISRGSNCSVAAVVVDSGSKCIVDSVNIIDGTTGILVRSTGTPTNTDKTTLSNIRVDSYTGVGIDIAKDVSQVMGSNIWCDANTIAGGGALIPRPGSTGFRQTGTSSTTAYGGHQWVNCIAINTETGWSFVDSTLTKLSNCAADGCSGRGISISGASDYIEMADLFLGVCGRMIEVAGTSSRCSLVGFRTNLSGEIPSWGGTTFFSSASPAYTAPFYDVALLNTAQLFIAGSTWIAGSGRAISVASGAALHLDGDNEYAAQTVATVAAGATTYIGVNAEQGTEQPTVWRAPYAGTLVKIFTACTAAPGAAKNYTYTVRLDFADTALVATTTGAATFSSEAFGEIAVTKGQTICTKLVTDAASTVTHHHVHLLFLKSWG